MHRLNSIRQHYRRFELSELGTTITIESLCLATIVVLGALAVLSSVRDAVISEASGFAGAVQNVNQSFSFLGVAGVSSNSAGSDFGDGLDFCDSPDDATGTASPSMVHLPTKPKHCLVSDYQRWARSNSLVSLPLDALRLVDLHGKLTSQSVRLDVLRSSLEAG